MSSMSSQKISSSLWVVASRARKKVIAGSRCWWNESRDCPLSRSKIINTPKYSSSLVPKRPCVLRSLNSNGTVNCKSARQYHSSPVSSFSVLRLGVGSQHWNSMGYDTYEQVIHQAMECGIPILEAGPATGTSGTAGDGDEALARCLRSYFAKTNGTTTIPVEPKPVQILLRVGYRVLATRSSSTETDTELNANDTGGGERDETRSSSRQKKTKRQLLFPQDVQLPQQQQQPQRQTSTKSSEALNSEDDVVVLHNIHPDYIEHFISRSACVALGADYPDRVRIIVLLHNPEEQNTTTSSVTPIDPNQERTRHRLSASLAKLQQLVDQNVIYGYGICSNGVCLPEQHPLHLSWNDTIVPAMVTAMQQVTQSPDSLSVTSSTESQYSSSFRVLQLPCNVMETTGFDIAEQIRLQQLHQPLKSLFASLQMLAMRPLTCYPDRGTGTGYPFLMIDYQLPSKTTTTPSNENFVWTNQMYTLPSYYDRAYKLALQHFDAQPILDAFHERQAAAAHRQQQKGTNDVDIAEDFTLEERETLEGCRVLQTLLKDMDDQLSVIRSIQHYQDDILNSVMPLIHNTFDGYDDDTAHILQSFFEAYSHAVRYAVASNTRRLVLLQHDEGHTPSDTQNDHITSTKLNASKSRMAMARALLSPDKRLQEFGIEFVLRQINQQSAAHHIQQFVSDAPSEKSSNDILSSKRVPEGNVQIQQEPGTSFLIDTVMVGCTEPWQVQDLVSIVQKIDKGNTST